MRELTVRPLVKEQIDQAFPLVQTSLPQVELEDWRKFAQELIRAKAPETTGIQTVLTEQHYIAGLSIYRIDWVLSHGPALVADHFMALDLFDREAVINALADFLEDLARQRGCTAIHTLIPERGGRWRGPVNCLASILRGRGHAIESLRLCKVLDEARTSG